jgi:hypothetical protein
VRKPRFFSSGEREKGIFAGTREGETRKSWNSGNILFRTHNSKFDKTLMLYAVRISWYYRENTKWNQQYCTILWTKAEKTAKKLKLEDPIPSKHELRLIIVRRGG